MIEEEFNSSLQLAFIIKNWSSGDKMVAGWARESILLDLLRFKEFRPASNPTVSVLQNVGKP